MSGINIHVESEKYSICDDLGRTCYELPQKHGKDIELQNSVEAYIQSLVLKKTLESISFDRRQGIKEKDIQEEIQGYWKG